MSFGKMNVFIDIVKTRMEKNRNGIMSPVDEVLHSVRAYREFQRGTERWANLAAFSTATCLFKFRKIPGLDVRPDMAIVCEGVRYRIISAEDVRGRGMYVETLVCAYEPTVY